MLAVLASVAMGLDLLLKLAFQRPRLNLLSKITAPTATALAVLLSFWAPRYGASQDPKPVPPEITKLIPLVGDWDVEFESRGGPTDASTVLFTTSRITQTLNGAFLQERLSMPMPSGSPIELIGIWGYDRFRSIYRFAWLDDTYALFDVHEGNWQGDSLVVSNTRTRTTLLIGGQEVFGRMIWSEIGPNGFTVESLASTDGGTTWFTPAKGRYTRRR